LSKLWSVKRELLDHSSYLNPRNNKRGW